MGYCVNHGSATPCTSSHSAIIFLVGKPGTAACTQPRLEAGRVKSSTSSHPSKDLWHHLSSKDLCPKNPGLSLSVKTALLKSVGLL